MFDTYERAIVPAAAERIESGVLQFSGDWPGLFVRGDDCMALAIALDSVMVWLRDFGDPKELRRISYAVGAVSSLKSALEMVSSHQAATGKR